MDSIELKCPTAEPPQNGDHTVAPQATAGETARRASTPAQQAPAFVPIPLDRAEVSAKPAAEAPSRHNRIAGVILALMVIGGLALGFLPRWRQRQVAMADSGQLAVPTVSVVRPTLEKAGDGLVLPAEIKPWLEASIYARANGYLKSWVADIGAHVEAGQLLALIEMTMLNRACNSCETGHTCRDPDRLALQYMEIVS